MGLAVVTVASGGLPIVESTVGGTPVTEAANGRGVPVTKVVGKPGLPVVFETIGVAVPFSPTTWSATDKTANTNLTNGNLTATAAAINSGARGVKGLAAGKSYFEATLVNQTSIATAIGVALGAATLGLTATTTAVLRENNSIWINNTSIGTAPGGSLVNGNIVGIAVDIDAQRIWFRSTKSAGVWNISGGDPATGVGGLSLAGMAGTLFPNCIMAGNTDAWTANFGASSFVGAVPAGFTSGWPA